MAAAAATAGGIALGAYIAHRTAKRGQDLDTKATKEQLAYMQRRDEQERQDYLEEQSFTRTQRAPFVNAGIGSLAQLSRPIAYTRPPQQGTLGDLMGKR